MNYLNTSALIALIAIIIPAQSNNGTARSNSVNAPPATAASNATQAHNENPNALTDSVVRIVQVIVSIIGLGFVTRQLSNQNVQIRAQKRISRADLILKISQYSLDEDYTNVVGVLEARVDNKQSNADLGDHKEKVRSFLRYLETVTLMLETHIIRDEDIFPLLGYRIFLVCADEAVQKEFFGEIVEGRAVAKQRFSAIFRLHDRLDSYLDKLFVNDKQTGATRKRLLEEYKIASERLLSTQSFHKQGLQFYKAHMIHRENPLDQSWVG